MNADQARAHFSEAMEGELDPGTQHAFDTLLANDATLRAEYDGFLAMIASTRGLALDAPAPDLLPAVQHKLRVRSGGRFYRDRFSEVGRARMWFPAFAAATTIVLVLAAWFLMF